MLGVEWSAKRPKHQYIGGFESFAGHSPPVVRRDPGNFPTECGKSLHIHEFFVSFPKDLWFFHACNAKTPFQPFKSALCSGSPAQIFLAKKDLWFFPTEAKITEGFTLCNLRHCTGFSSLKNIYIYLLVLSKNSVPSLMLLYKKRNWEPKPTTRLSENWWARWGG